MWFTGKGPLLSYNKGSLFKCNSLNEHAPYKRGVARPKWHSQKSSDMHKNCCPIPVRRMSKKQPKPRIHEQFLAQNSCYIQSLYTKVDTVARASTCDSCFRRAITNTKKSNEHRLLSGEQTLQGFETQLIAARKKRTSFSVVCIQHRCPWVRAIVWQADCTKFSCKIVYWSSAKKTKSLKYHPSEQYTV